MHRLRLFTVAFILLTASIFGAQSAQNVKLRGTVVDTTGAIMPATNVKAYQKGQLVKEALTTNEGTFELDLAPGQYGVEVSAPDFTPFRQTVQLSTTTQPLAVTLAVATVETVVNVTDDPNSVKVDLDSVGLGATTITGDLLEDLPDNEDDLATYLQQLAGAKGGVDQTPQFIIDGFAGGRLPPKDQIAQIIIEDNPFGAGAAGGGPRIRIITKPGTGTWRLGEVRTTFGNSAFNTRQANATNKPQSNSRTFQPNLSGPIIPGRVTMNFAGQTQDNESEGNSIIATTPDGVVTHGLVNPRTQRTISPRFNIRLTDKSRMNVNFNYSTNHSTSQGGNYSLIETGSKSQQNRFTFQVSENTTIKKMENEIRFQVNTSHNTSNPTSTTGAYAGIYSINVTDAFTGGPAQNNSNTTSRSFQLADQLRGQFKNGKIQLNTGVELDYNSDNSFSQSNYTGTFRYASLYDYCYAYYQAFGSFNNYGNCQPTADALAANPTNPTFTNSAGTVVKITGIPTQFTKRAGDPTIKASLGTASAYVESVFRISKRFQMQTGIRYQVQQYVTDYNGVAPRLQMRYQLTSKTILNGGAGMISNENAFSLNQYENTLRNDGSLRQYQILLNNPNFSPWNVPDLSSYATSLATTISRLGREYAIPYSIRTQFGVDQKLTNKLGLNVTYSFNRGIHQNLSRNINAPLPDCVNLLGPIRTTDQLAGCRPNPLLGNINEYEAVGLSRSKNLSFQVRMQNLGNQNSFTFGMQASYTLGYSYDTGGSPTNNYDIFSDWARSNNDQRHRVQAQMSLNYQPWGLQLQLQPRWNSGTPYNITTGTDLNGDGSINDRPLGVGRNTGQGPNNYSISGSISKTFQLKHLRGGNQGNNFGDFIANAYAEPQRGGGGGGGFGGNQGGGRNNNGGFGGDGGNRGNNRGNNPDFRGGDFPGGDFPNGDFIGNRGQNGNRGNRGNRGQQNGPRMQLRLQVNNITNHPTYNIQSGALTSPYFGVLKGNGARTVTISLNFQNLF